MLMTTCSGMALVSIGLARGRGPLWLSEGHTLAIPLQATINLHVFIN